MKKMLKPVKFISAMLSVLMSLSLLSVFSVGALEYSGTEAEALNSQYNFPLIFIDTDNGAPIVDKTNYVGCTVRIDNTSSQYLLDDTLGGIRYRGNSTLQYADKKAYRIKFDKKQDLFGMGKAKSWVLLANAFDKTMVRNALAFEIARELGLEFTSEYRFVNVFLNGENLGLYLLCEQTQTGETRVDIEEDETGRIDTGYLIEFVGNGDTNEDAYFNVVDVDPSLFPEGVTLNWRKNVMKFIIKTPEKEFCTPSQIDFISEYCNSFNKAILTHDWDTFDRLCDVDSFVKFFIVNTVMNNGDGGYQIYFYKKENGGKVFAGPVWDFDQSAAASTQCTNGYSKWYYGSQNPWFDSFVAWDRFMELARECYDEHIDNIKKIIDYYTVSFYPGNEFDFNANDMVWNSLENDYWRITSQISALKTFEDNFEHLSEWFENRILWLDANFHDLGEYVFDDNSTCVSDATESAKCRNCDYVSVRKIKNTVDASKHSFTDYIYNNDATCINDGTMTRTCRLCSMTETIADPQHKADGKHTLGEYVYNNDATVQSDGTKSAVCRVCGYIDTVIAQGTKLPYVEMRDTSKVFTDIKSDSWYKPYIDYAYSYGLLRGMTDTEFEPSTTLSRAMFVTVIARIAGVDTASRTEPSPFTDVEDGRYYTAAVGWAAQNGIVNGVTENTFEPASDITREQLCAVLVRYADFAGVMLKNDGESLLFDDDSMLHDYAREAVYACRAAGIVGGTKTNEGVLFNPRDGATRAEASKILGIFHDDYIEIKK